MILVIDNYDSFTFNLVELLRRDAPVRVVRNDELSLAELISWPLRGVVISPGPGRPSESGVSAEVIHAFAGRLPVLGVCLGHQLMAEMWGGSVVHGLRPMHGKTSRIRHDGKGLFRALPQDISVMRYHSLVVDPQRLPDSLTVSAWGTEGEIMGIRHKFYNLAGVQFHPESILTPDGETMIRNWIGDLPPINKLCYDP